MNQLNSPTSSPSSSPSEATGSDRPASASSGAGYAGDYDANYYAHGCGRPYQRDEVWLRFFKEVAQRIDEGIAPESVLGCGLRDGLPRRMLERERD